MLRTWLREQFRYGKIGSGGLKMVLVLGLGFLLPLASIAFAQSDVRVSRAELAVPFGTVEGKIVVLSDQLVFIDDDRPEHSFAFNRSSIARSSIENGVVTIETQSPFRDRAGERSRAILRMKDSSAANFLAEWAQRGPQTSGSAARISEPAPAVGRTEPTEGFSFQVSHKHGFRGNCRGRLIAMPHRVAFESIDKIDHSQQWAYADIKELKQPNAYEIEIRPFTGDGFNFNLVGKGMGSEEYRYLVDRVTKARVAK